MYKLAVLDIDGTLIDDKSGRVPEANKKAIKRLVDSGFNVSICTGRNIRRTAPIAKEAGITSPVCCIDGTLLYDCQNDKILKDYSMTHYETFKIIDAIKENASYIELSDGYKYYKYSPRKELLVKYDVYNKHTFTGRIKSFKGGIRYFKSIDSFYDVNPPYYQVVAGGPDKDIKELSANIKLILNETIDENTKEPMSERIEIRDNLWPGYMFINRKGIRKANGVKMLCEHFGVDISEVVAIGDDLNDLDMIHESGMGVAMGNAAEAVKDVADFITDTNYNGGVAKALERFFEI